MSYCVSAILAANKAVMAPNILMRAKAQGKWLIMLLQRNNKNTPATTIVDLCRRADTGVGPSIAAGNHGCSLNCADFPAAANIMPKIAM